jgi:hypothetical protein
VRLSFVSRRVRASNVRISAKWCASLCARFGHSSSPPYVVGHHSTCALSVHFNRLPDPYANSLMLVALAIAIDTSQPTLTRDAACQTAWQTGERKKETGHRYGTGHDVSTRQDRTFENGRTGHGTQAGQDIGLVLGTAPPSSMPSKRTILAMRRGTIAIVPDGFCARRKSCHRSKSFPGILFTIGDGTIECASCASCDRTSHRPGSIRSLDDWARIQVQVH